MSPGSKGTLAAGLLAGAGAWYMVSRRGRGKLQPDPFRGRVALVMGGSRGLGLLLGRELARAGCHVVLAARDAAELDRARGLINGEGVDVFTVPCDVTDRARVEALRVLDAEDDGLQERDRDRTELPLERGEPPAEARRQQERDAPDPYGGLRALDSCPVAGTRLHELHGWS